MKKIKKQKFTNYKFLIKILKNHCPAAYPVSVRRVALGGGLDGDCYKEKKKFLIRINRDLDEWKAIDTLLHEWAHARAWNHLLDSAETEEHFESFSHDASWGVAYSEVYRTYEKHFLYS
jgi:hypothetical protein